MSSKLTEITIFFHQIRLFILSRLGKGMMKAEKYIICSWGLKHIQNNIWLMGYANGQLKLC